ncbi:hypothetical protein QOZ80_2BG0158260 [Eleusine coracana subsp. coracana]|nr:hypothetical protein QOZ80_2BG0158260 [Eleusine coracana subsp. coracana]
MNNPASGSGRTWQNNSTVAVSTSGYQGWAMLDPWPLDEDPAATSTGLAICPASDGQALRVSLRLAAPPAHSYLHLHTDSDLNVKPSLLAADGALLLLHMTVSVVRNNPTFPSFETNFFVYKAHPEMAWLRLLPEFEDHCASVGHTGIANKDDDDYVVAGFRVKMLTRDECATWDDEDEEDGYREVGELSRFSSSTDRWDLVELPIPFDPDKGLFKFVWDSDDLFALDGFMFWVDYHRGMLYCDVFAESPSLRFIQLPGIRVWGQDQNYSNGRQLPRAYRTVGVCRGAVKFVDIDDGFFGTRKTSGFRITTWSLNMADLVWVKDSVVEVDDLWLQPEFQDSTLPRWAPEFPVVNKQDGDLLHCILRGPELLAKT